MPTRLIAIFCAALLGTACTAPASRTAVAPDAASEIPANDGDAGAAPAVAANAEEEDPLVCENVVQTGTRVAQRVCMRRSQTEAHKSAANEMLGEVQRRGVLVNETKD